MENLNRIFLRDFGRNVKDVPGSGAAGGLGAGGLVFLNASIRGGIDTIMNILSYRQKAKNADVLITGEGKVDKQTLSGKVVQGVVKVGQQLNKPVIIFCGKSEVEKGELGSNVEIVPLMSEGMK